MLPCPHKFAFCAPPVSKALFAKSSSSGLEIQEFATRHPVPSVVFKSSHPHCIQCLGTALAKLTSAGRSGDLHNPCCQKPSVCLGSFSRFQAPHVAALVQVLRQVLHNFLDVLLCRLHKVDLCRMSLRAALQMKLPVAQEQRKPKEQAQIKVKNRNNVAFQCLLDSSNQQLHQGTAGTSATGNLSLLMFKCSVTLGETLESV